MTKHTPGPWKVFESDVSGLSVNMPGRRICDVHKNPKDDDRANARLIAAAPEMLEALMLAEKRLCELAKRLPEHVQNGKTLEFVRAAIAKGEGHTS